MKKILALALALVLVLSLAACGANDGAAEVEAPVVDEAEVEVAAPAEEPAVVGEEAAGDASGEMGDASGEMGSASGEMNDASGEMGEASSDEMGGASSGEPMPANGEIEITVDGVTDLAQYEESDNGDQATKGLTVTFNGATYTGSIDRGVYTADNEADQPIFSALQTAREAAGAGMPSEEPEA